MKIRKKTGLKIVIVVTIMFLVASLILPFPCSLRMPVAIFVLGQQAQRMRARVLCKTDHQVLLEACREVLTWTDLEPGRRYLIRSAPRRPEVSEFPQAIIDLAPNYVSVHRDGYMKLEMHGGMDHFGVYAYPEDYQKLFHNFEYRDRKLIEGLWYYDDGYLHNPEYDKRIDALIQKWK